MKKRIGLGFICASLFLVYPAYGQVSALLPNKFQASPLLLSGPLSPRYIGIQDIHNSLIANSVTGNNRAMDITSTGGTTMLAGTAPIRFIATENIPTYPSTTMHFGQSAICAKNGTFGTASSSGSRTCFVAQQNGAGGVLNDFFTAGLFQAHNTYDGPPYVNLRGQWFSLNSDTIIEAGTTPDIAVSTEMDIRTYSHVTNVREALRIGDINSTGTWAGNTDAAIGITAKDLAPGSIGFEHMIQLCDYLGGIPAYNCPIKAGSDILNAGAVSAALDSYMNFGGLTGAPALAGILLPQNVTNGIGFGSRIACCAGGKIQSSTNSGGGALVFLADDTVIQQPFNTSVLHVTTNGVESFRLITRSLVDPTVGACGTGPTISNASTNASGAFTTGTSGSPTSCTITLATLVGVAGWPVSAFCVITPTNAAASIPNTYISAQTRSAFTVTLGTGTNSAAFNYYCGGN